jgi:twitching motility protein PilT
MDGNAPVTPNVTQNSDFSVSQFAGVPTASPAIPTQQFAPQPSQGLPPMPQQMQPPQFPGNFSPPMQQMPQMQPPSLPTVEQQMQNVSQLPPLPQQAPQSVSQPAITASSAPMVQILGSDAGGLSIFQMLELVSTKNASDLHLVVGYPAMLRIDGDLVNISSTIITPELAKKLVYDVLPDDKKEQLEVNREVDLAYGYEGVGRFRINAYYQRGYISAAFRLIPTRIRTLDELKVPAIFKEFAELEQGLVLVTGPTGHGKSTTLAAIIQQINDNHPKHILTIEDPIEYVFPQSKALVSQRELGDDTHSWKGALRAALREDPDVVLVGEMRDYETVNSAITVAETGHLVLATLHTNNAAQTIQRIINVFPDVQQEEVRAQLADILEVVIAQRLIPIKGGGRRAAVEIMLMTPAIRNLIRENKIFQIDNVIRTSLDLGMITLERSLLNLYRDGMIEKEDALRFALDSSEMQRLINEG